MSREPGTLIASLTPISSLSGGYLRGDQKQTNFDWFMVLILDGSACEAKPALAEKNRLDDVNECLERFKLPILLHACVTLTI